MPPEHLFDFTKRYRAIGEHDLPVRALGYVLGVQANWTQPDFAAMKHAESSPPPSTPATRTTALDGALCDVANAAGAAGEPGSSMSIRSFTAAVFTRASIARFPASRRPGR